MYVKRVITIFLSVAFTLVLCRCTTERYAVDEKKNLISFNAAVNPLTKASFLTPGSKILIGYKCISDTGHFQTLFAESGTSGSIITEKSVAIESGLYDFFSLTEESINCGPFSVNEHSVYPLKQGSIYLLSYIGSVNIESNKKIEFSLSRVSVKFIISLLEGDDVTNMRLNRVRAIYETADGSYIDIYKKKIVNISSEKEELLIENPGNTIILYTIPFAKDMILELNISGKNNGLDFHDKTLIANIPGPFVGGVLYTADITINRGNDYKVTIIKGPWLERENNIIFEKYQ